MFQILFFGVDKSGQSWYCDIIRGFFAFLDTIVYGLLSVIYEILFNLANSTIISSSTIKIFYRRVQLIIGVFMIFKLAISLLQFVINPDAFSDQKKGFSQIITRIIIMLLMFTAIIPLKIPNAVPGSYNAYLNQNGLLFGTMYSLQARILKQGVIQKLILGYTTPDSEETNAASGTNEDSGNAMANYLLRVFVRINLIDGDKPIEEDNYKVSETDLESKYSDVYDIYNDTNASAFDLLLNINATDGKYYAFSYTPIISTIIGLIVFVIICSFCIDVATRSLKLAILRLIAPIPIISYIDPKSSEKGSFATWVKMLMSTFLNLFIILAVIHFAIFLVEQLISFNALSVSFSDSDKLVVNSLTIVFIIVGIFFFARQAPKFIMDALGIKSMGLGAGLSGLLGATGALMGGGGLSGAAAGFLESADAAADAAAQGKQAPSAYSTQRDKIAKLQTGDKDAKGGLLGNVTKAARDRANANMAERFFGVNRNKVAEAKNLKYTLEGEASAAEEAYKRFANNQMTAAERLEIENGDSFNDYLAHNGINDYAAQNDDTKNYIMQQYLEEDMGQKRTLSAKQDAWFKEGSNVLEGMGINETYQEKYSARGRSRAIRTHDQNLAAQGTDRNYKVQHTARPKTEIDREDDIRRLNGNNNP